MDQTYSFSLALSRNDLNCRRIAASSFRGNPAQPISSIGSGSTIICDLLGRIELVPTDLPNSIQLFLKDGGGNAIIGKAYYPRYFFEGERLVDFRTEVLGKLDQRYTFDRIEFYQVGSDTAWVVLPTLEIPASFPHGSEVISFGCLQDGVLDAQLVS